MDQPVTTEAAASPARYRRVPYALRETVFEQRADGTLILRSTGVPRTLPRLSFADDVAHWAARRGDAVAVCERDADGEWRRIEWRELWRQVQAVGAGLLELGLGPERPIMLLSGNSLEQLALLLAAEYVGVPTAPVAPAYSLASQDFVRLKGVAELLPPALLFVQDGAAFAPAVAALAAGGGAIPVIAVHGAQAGQHDWAALANTELTPQRLQRIAAAHDARQGSDLVRVVFTSGSTGLPKGVALSYRNLQATAANLLDMFEPLLDGPTPVFLDWLPWHHALGGVLNVGRSMLLGATHYIDDGRPLPGRFDKTVRNLREVSPTVMNTVPAAWAMLAPALERDAELARNFFARVVSLSYGGASLPREVHDRIQRVAERTVGERIVFGTGLASTETTGTATIRLWPSENLADVGAPGAGTEIKLIPVDDGRHEMRVRGDHVFAGYLKRPELTREAFDEEGYFRIGDAVRLVDPHDPRRGMVFDGRLAEDFKLSSGTWVRTGALRLALVDRCSPLLVDAVICGHDRDYVAALAWPNVAACRRLAPELAGLDAAALVRHPTLLAVLRERLRDGAAAAKGGSLSVDRLLLMDEPPSVDANEIADKGYVNQAATRARRAGLVDELYQPNPSAQVLLLR